jgi:hypothetical protein
MSSDPLTLRAVGPNAPRRWDPCRAVSGLRAPARFESVGRFVAVGGRAVSNVRPARSDAPGEAMCAPCRPGRQAQARCRRSGDQRGRRAGAHPVSGAHGRESSCQLSAERRVETLCGGFVLVVGAAAVDTAAGEGAQLTVLDPPAATDQVGRDPIQPRKRTVCCTTGRAPFECDRERSKSA